jgi:excinuclease UvrABC helicase subunit UvrB
VKLDLPEVSLVAILDADREDSCAARFPIQTMGRAAAMLEAHYTMPIPSPAQ